MAETIYIIDGHAQIFAAYFAPMSANLTAPNGEPTKATLIFTTMLLKILREKNPDKLIVAMDSGGPTFRHEMFKDYKANRPPIPEDLPAQIDRIEEIVQAMNIPKIKIAGFEADDIIGTLCKKYTAQGDSVVICSGDKDLEQLLNDSVQMYEPRKGSTRTVESLLEDKGIRPDQVIDVLALAGDKSDNIPGVPDVGPKTALQWIQKYGSIDEIIAHQDEIKGKRGNNLRENVDILKISRDLATINCEVPLEIDTLEFKPADQEKLAEIFVNLNFTRLLDQLDVTPPSALVDSPAVHIPEKPTELDYQLVTEQAQLDNLIAELSKQKRFAVDTETTGLNPVAAELVGMSFSFQPGRAWYLPIKAPLGQKCLDRDIVIDAVRPILENPKIEKIGQNIKYDIVVFKRAGIELQGVTFDTMVASYLLDSTRSSHGMDALSQDYLGHETLKLETLIGKGKNQLTFDMVDLQAANDYAAEDADITWRLGELFNNQLSDKEMRKLFETVEMPLVQVLATMEYHGIALDAPYLKKLSTQIGTRLEEITDTIYKEAGCTFNVDSPKQLAEVLFDKIGLTPVKKTKTGASTDQEVLEALRWEHPIPELMLEYRQLSKLKNTYVDKLPSMIFPGTGRIHASFNQAVAATGRLSSSNPNLQNIPIRTDLGQEIRRAFIPQKEGYSLLAADYSQIELRLLAHFSGDKALLEAFRSGQDIHSFVAAQVYDIDINEVDKSQRSKAKAVNFGIIYGQTAFGLSRSIGIPAGEAQTFINDYFDRYPEIKSYMDTVIANAKKDGFVKTALGRRRAVPELNSRNANLRKFGERMAVNTVIQGSAADLIKVAMVNVYDKITKTMPNVRMILQIHDELVFELPTEDVPAFSDFIRQEMTSAMDLNVPLLVDIGYGDSWLDCK